MCAEATDTDIWNSFRAKGDGNGSLSICSQDSRLHGIIEKFFFKKKNNINKSPPQRVT